MKSDSRWVRVAITSFQVGSSSSGERYLRSTEGMGLVRTLSAVNIQLISMQPAMLLTKFADSGVPPDPNIFRPYCYILLQPAIWKPDFEEILR